MTDYINKQDAYRIALHDGGPVCAEKIAQLEPLKINLKPATLDPKTVTWSGVDLGGAEEDLRDGRHCPR